MGLRFYYDYWPCRILLVLYGPSGLIKSDKWLQIRLDLVYRVNRRIMYHKTVSTPSHSSQAGVKSLSQATTVTLSYFTDWNFMDVPHVWQWWGPLSVDCLLLKLFLKGWFAANRCMWGNAPDEILKPDVFT